MKLMKKMLVVVLLLALALGSISCSNKPDDSKEDAKEDDKGKEKIRVAVSLPTKEQSVWTRYSNSIEKAFAGDEYELDIQFAEDKTDLQISQIENMMINEPDFFIITSVDTYAMTDIMDKVKQQKPDITIIACDRLIMDTEKVDYYIAFDLVKIGELQGQYIADKLDLENQSGPFYLEIFSGSPADSNSIPFYEGAMSVLNPYLEEGKLVCKSGQVSLDVTGTMNWEAAIAQARMDNLLSAYYSDTDLDAALVAADVLSLGVVASLSSMGYGGDSGKKFPIVTGQDAEIASVKSILAGEQSMTVALDTELSAACMKDIVDTIASGEEPVPDDTTTYNNNVKNINSFLLEPTAIDKDNYELLFEWKILSEDDLK